MGIERLKEGEWELKVGEGEGERKKEEDHHKLPQRSNRKTATKKKYQQGVVKISQ